MFLGLRTVVYPVADIAASTSWFTRLLGVAPYFEEPYYVGFDVQGYEPGLRPAGQSGAPEGDPVAYWGVPDAARALEVLLAEGASPHGPVQQVGGGIRLAGVVGPGGNVLGIIENPHFRAAEPSAAGEGPGR